MKDILFQNEYIKKLRLKNFLISILYVILSLINALIPLSLIKVLDYIIQKKVKFAIFAMITVSILYILLVCLKSLIEYSSVVVKERNKIEIIRVLINKISKQKTSSIDTNKYLSWIFNDVESIINLYITNLFNLYACISMLIFSMISILYINKYIMVLVIALSIVSLSIPKIFVKRLKIVQKKLNDSQEKHLFKIKNFLLGMIYFIYNNKRSKFINLIRKENLKLKEATILNFKENDIYESIMNLFSVLSKFLISAVICILIYLGKVSFGTFFGIVSIYNNFLNSFLTLSGIVGRIKVGKSIFDKFDLEVLEETENRIKIDKINSISMENVSVANKLKSLTTSFQKSNKYSIVGESGSGKTTLIRTILGFEKYDGNILVNGINIKNIDMKNVYNEIDYVNDDKNILLGNIYENISLFKQYNKQKIDKILNLLNLTHLSTYDILSNDKLSTGEIARVKLARLIYDDKDILILDEALANIDVKNRDIINNYLSTTNKTIIEVTHHLDEKLKYNVIALK